MADDAKDDAVAALRVREAARRARSAAVPAIAPMRPDARPQTGGSPIAGEKVSLAVIYQQDSRARLIALESNIQPQR